MKLQDWVAYSPCSHLREAQKKAMVEVMRAAMVAVAEEETKEEVVEVVAAKVEADWTENTEMAGSKLPALGQTVAVEEEGGEKKILAEVAEADIETAAVEVAEGAGFLPEGWNAAVEMTMIHSLKVDNWS